MYFTHTPKIETYIKQPDIPNLYADIDIEFGIHENPDKNPVYMAEKHFEPMIIDLKIKDPPPTLEFIINPKTMTTTLNKMLRPQFTRSGWITQYPGDEMPSIDMTGTICGFYNERDGLSGSPFQYTKLNNYEDKSKERVLEVSRISSVGYQWLIKLLSFYKNNGCNINADDRRRIDSVGSVEIYYENTTLIGSFRSFEFSEDENRPHTMDYSFNFRVRQIV